jgi:hypothetical protein
MSTTQDPGNGTNETTGEQAAEILPSGLREGYAEIGDVRLHYVEAGPTPRTGCITTRPSALPNCSSTSSPRPCPPRDDAGVLQGLQTRGPLELDLGDRLGAL